MSDDLSSFFAKKAAKSKDKKKKGKVSVDDVGQVLERKAKRQEERDRETEEDEKRAQEEANFFEKRTEDSEWLEFKDTNKEMSLEELGIRDMNLTEQVKEEHDEQEKTVVEAPKSWNTGGAEAKEQEPEVHMAPAKPAIYRPRHVLAHGTVRAGAAPNIADQEMFPSFEAANKMEKQRKDFEKKKNDGFTTVTSDRDTRDTGNAWSNRAPATNAWQRGATTTTPSSGDRAALLSAVKQVTASGAPNPTPPPAAAPAAPRNPNAYVPPSRRRTEA